MERKIILRVGILFILIVTAGFFGYFLVSILTDKMPEKLGGGGKKNEIFQLPKERMEKFKSKEDLMAYLRQGEALYGGEGGLLETRMVAKLQELSLDFSDEVNSFGSNEMGAGSVSERVSQTNTQVLSIDEPDIVKTDGKRMYFAGENFWRGEMVPLRMEDGDSVVSSEKDIAGSFPGIAPYENRNRTLIFQVFPPEELEKIGTVDKKGDLLLSDNNLFVFSGNGIFAYNVKDPKNPQEKWQLSYGKNSNFLSARLYDDKIYLITNVRTSYLNPCPIDIFTTVGKPYSLRCADIYHPVDPIAADTTYIVSVIDPQSGEVEKSRSFLGSFGNTQVYMSEKNVYVTYERPGDFLGLMVDFLKENKDIFPEDMLSRVEKIKSYDLSFQAKMAELTFIMGSLENSLGADEVMKIENEMNNRMTDFAKKNKRRFQSTGIVRVEADSLEVSAAGSVPGRLLNQFALDEFDGNLRLATTVGENSGFGFRGSSETANDAYVLNEKMEIVGSVTDMGKGERIYSVRFIGETGYVVTFKQTDPFFVLDLSNPKKPEIKGELKIPGFSSYLHPLEKNRILGVGMENGQVKLSLFDVSNPEDPREMAKYNLDEYWTEVSNNHHAFLQDSKHKIFFLPGGKGGYIFSYEKDGLEMKKAISGNQIKRAFYIGDYFYVIGEGEIFVLDEKTWEKIKELTF